MRLQDKATIVMGASSGLAEAIALGFAREVAMIIGENRWEGEAGVLELVKEEGATCAGCSSHDFAVGGATAAGEGCGTTRSTTPPWWP